MPPGESGGIRPGVLALRAPRARGSQASACGRTREPDDVGASQVHPLAGVRSATRARGWPRVTAGRSTPRCGGVIATCEFVGSACACSRVEALTWAAWSRRELGTAPQLSRPPLFFCRSESEFG